jgi:hypothetical protein
MKEGREREVNTRIQERRHLPFSNSIRAERERDRNAHNLHKALSNREKKKKVDISTKIFLSW